MNALLHIVHPGMYFHQFEGQDLDYFSCDEALKKLKKLVDFFTKHELPIIPIRDISHGLMIEVITNMNLDAVGLSCLINEGQRNGFDPAYEHLTELYSLSKAVVLPADIHSNSRAKELLEAYPTLLTRELFLDTLSPHASGIHYVAGGEIGHCVANWGEDVKQQFPDADVVFIDDLCVPASAEYKQRGVERIRDLGGRLVSLEDVYGKLRDGTTNS